MRLTAFPASGPRAANAEAWWLALFGVPHEKSNQDLKNSATQLLGTVKDAFMVALENPVSFELTRLAGDPAQPPPDAHALPPYPVSVPPFLELALRWLGLENCPRLRRLAFGATLLHPVANREQGHEILDSYLPHVVVDPLSSDFMYHINRRRPSSTIGDLSLNRLSKWSIQQSRNLMFGADGSLTQGPEMFACRVELDINSVPSKQLLPQDRLPELFVELVTLANEIAREGDVS